MFGCLQSCQPTSFLILFCFHAMTALHIGQKIKSSDKSLEGLKKFLEKKQISFDFVAVVYTERTPLGEGRKGELRWKLTFDLSSEEWQDPNCTPTSRDQPIAEAWPAVRGVATKDLALCSPSLTFWAFHVSLGAHIIQAPRGWTLIHMHFPHSDWVVKGEYCTLYSFMFLRQQWLVVT